MESSANSTSYGVNCSAICLLKLRTKLSIILHLSAAEVASVKLVGLLNNTCRQRSMNLCLDIPVWEKFAAGMKSDEIFHVP